MMSNDTITAITTPPGRGGVGIVRLSGPEAAAIGSQILQKKDISPRHAHYQPFFDSNKQVIDQGIALYFPGPHSFTGEDVFEFQGHGGPVILDLILQRTIELGARIAQPGEFSQRAFLNDKLDLTQAEAIADLIEASSEQAARNAVNSLQGVFSEKIGAVLEDLIKLRIYVEAAIDFPEEEIDFLGDGIVLNRLAIIIESLDAILASAKQGALMREGMNVVIAGRPNAGKSSLLNSLSGKQTAIVTNIAGTTRDVLREYIHIDGMPLHIVDTAGLRESPDEVEQIGIERAWKEIDNADRVLLIADSTTVNDLNPDRLWKLLTKDFPDIPNLTLVMNKSDISDIQTGFLQRSPHTVIGLSAQSGHGMSELKQHLKDCMGFTGAGEGTFTARRRHLEALFKAKGYLTTGLDQLQLHQAGELLAEDLRQCQHCLNEITGEFTSDDLLGRIFSSFCIGK